MNTLPDKPSELIGLALHDLELCEKDPRYEIDMANWHNPHGEDGKCAVCFAGATLAKSLNVHPSEAMEPPDFDEDTEAKLGALNEFRTGDVYEGLYLMGIEYPDDIMESDVAVVPYITDPEAFKADMRKLADTLEEHGL